MSEPPINPSRRWKLLRFLLVAGIVTMFVGPCVYGIDRPVRAVDANRYRVLTYVLLPTGAVIALGSAIGIYLIDRKRR